MIIVEENDDQTPPPPPPPPLPMATLRSSSCCKSSSNALHSMSMSMSSEHITSQSPPIQPPPNHNMVYSPYIHPAAMMFPPPSPHHYYNQFPPTFQNYQTQPNQSWSAGLFNCLSNPKNTFITMFCPWFTFGQIAEIVNEGQTPWWEGMLTYQILLLSPILTFACLYACIYRGKMRRKYMLKGDCFTDLIITCFCHPCALCQGYRQLDHLGFEVALGWQHNKEREWRKATESLYQVPPFAEQRMHR